MEREWLVVSEHCNDAAVQRRLNALSQTGWELFCVYRACDARAIHIVASRRQKRMNIATRELWLLFAGLAVALFMLWIACRWR